MDNWECLRFTSYVYASTPLSNAQASAYNAQGFEVGAARLEQLRRLDARLAGRQLHDATERTGGRSTPASRRRPPTGCTASSGRTGPSQPTIEGQNGIRLDTNYYYWPGSWLGDRPGFMTGSGMPMRFSAKTGGLIDVYQAATQMTDESGQSYPFTPNTLLDNATGPLGYYGAFTANEHTDNATTFESDQLLASAMAHGVPMVTGRQMLTWLDGRNGSSYSGTSWSGQHADLHRQRRCRRQRADRHGADARPGRQHPDRPDPSAAARSPFTRTTIKGVEYAMFLAAAGELLGDVRTAGRRAAGRHRQRRRGNLSRGVSGPLSQLKAPARDVSTAADVPTLAAAAADHGRAGDLPGRRSTVA